MTLDFQQTLEAAEAIKRYDGLSKISAGLKREQQSPLIGVTIHFASDHPSTELTREWLLKLIEDERGTILSRLRLDGIEPREPEK